MSEVVEVIVPEPSRPHVLEELEPLPTGVTVLAEPSGKRQPERLVLVSLSDLDSSAEDVAMLLRRVRNLVAHFSVILFQDDGRGRPVDWDLLQKSLVIGSEIRDAPYVAPDWKSLRRILLARRRDAEDELIASASIEDRTLWLWSCEPKLYRCPAAVVPALSALSTEELRRFELSESGSRIRWPEQDIDLSLEAIRAHVDPKTRREQERRFRRDAQRYGRAIKKLREQQGIKQTDIEDISDRELRRLESGSVFPHTSTLEKLAKAHEMTVEEYMSKLATFASKRRGVTSSS